MPDLWTELLRSIQPCGIAAVVLAIFCIYLMWKNNADCKRHDQSQKDMIELLEKIALSRQ